MDDRSKIGLAVAAVVIAVVYAVTNRFALPEQTISVSTDNVTFAASTPSANDDITLGYLPGHTWVNQTASEAYLALDTSNGVADWGNITQGGGTGDNVSIDGVGVNDPDFVSTGDIDFVDTSNTITANINSSVIVAGDFANNDWGDITVASNVATLDADTVSANELNDGADTPLDEECLTWEAAGSVIEYQACSAGAGDNVSIDGVGVTDPDFVSTGDIDFVDTSNTITANINNGVVGSTEITNDSVTPVDIDAVDSEVDEECVTYEATGTAFEFQECHPFGVSIDSSEITDDTVAPVDIDAVDIEVDEECLTYEATGTAFEFQDCNAGTDISDDTNLTCGTNCTLTGDEISVDDSFLLNTGDVGTGAYDFGGASDFEIPNSATQTPNANGEIAADSTDDQLKYYSTQLNVLSAIYTKSAVIFEPADSDSIPLWRVPYNITILNWSCVVDPSDTGESVVGDLQETDSNADTGVSIDTTVTCANTTTTDDGTLSNPTLDANDFLLLDVGSVTGTVTTLTITWQYRIDAT